MLIQICNVFDGVDRFSCLGFGVYFDVTSFAHPNT